VSTVISFEHVSKKFALHRQRARSFQELALGLFRRNGGVLSGSPELAHVSSEEDSREDFWALRDVSFTVEQGEAVGFIGSNGAGKSTALKLVSRILTPTSGRIEVDGRMGALLELGAGFHPDLTGRENVYLNGSFLGLSRAQIRQKMDEIVAFAELERFIDVPVKHYSSGMYVRLGFSVAVHTDPEVLLIDEVLAVGDQNFQHKCFERIIKLRQEGVTICFVSHGLGYVRRLCSRVLWLDDGVIQASGDVDDTISAYLHHAAAEENARIKAEEPSQEGVKKASRKRRWGTGEVEIVDISFLNAAGGERNVFRVGETWVARLRYRASRRIENPVFGLSIRRDDGLHVCGPNTQFAGLDIPFVEGEGDVLYRVDSLPLLEGTYLVSVSAHNQADTVMYDYHDSLYTFRVRQVEKDERYGLVSLQGEWEIV
jgi:lipopolysaccharide transport system ATP-binding protein